jgi:hypothetical protein
MKSPNKSHRLARWCVRQNASIGVLWTARMEIPSAGAPNELTEEQLSAMLTPRTQMTFEPIVPS